ncbi:phosphomannomutase/phosphoglucomutase [Desulfosudis oleivorans]|uniref:Phosphomannomutase n=1 Tax=Desulfosudis oleivorans (strain DSM 6200 / JCM 39069 / Hxd3) TaxID=96561 RepID=A8ZXM3_DESOH|nr:phosphomannomutase/phosphoglucomutase [Desulfosudis oleivorans]ABW66981.1 Phosphomannomutase [Desulfosudis oleivorans Hxd3]
MDAKIFREYDIRGVAGTDLTEADVLLIGKAAGTYLRNHGKSFAAVGRDCRLTSPSYAEKIIEGLRSTGCDVLDLGICPTPVFYFAIHHFKTGGGVMITASHNPPEYNGFKLCIDLDSIHGKDILKLKKIIDSGDFVSGSGSLESADPVAPYRQYVESNISISRKLKVGVDAGNGTAGVVAVPVLKALGCEVHDIYCDMDGTFPNHEADPTVLKNMADLITMVREKKLDVGIGYDGDGDRIGVVDENGNIVYGDKLIILFAREILSRKPGAVFVSEVKCSKVMYDDIEKHGGRAIMWKTGHSLIKAKMKEEKAALAGEMSGHIFFADRYLGYDDAIYSSCRLLELIADAGNPISSLLSDIPKTFTTPEIRVECPDDKKFDLVKRVTEHFRKTHKVVDIDGVRVLFDDGWGLVRASNTQPALVMRFEAMSEDRLAEIQKLVEDAVDLFK